MKRVMKIGTTLLIVLFCLSMSCIAINASTVKQLEIDKTHDGIYTRDIVSAKDKNGKVIWKYITEKYMEAELEHTGKIMTKKYAFIFEGNKVVKLQRDTGKKIWSIKNIEASGSSMAIDKKGNLYIIGYYRNILYKITKSGKLAWKKDLQPTGYWWPYKLKASGNAIRVTFSKNPKAEDGKYYKYFDNKDGKMKK